MVGIFNDRITILSGEEDYANLFYLIQDPYPVPQGLHIFLPARQGVIAQGAVLPGIQITLFL